MVYIHTPRRVASFRCQLHLTSHNPPTLIRLPLCQSSLLSSRLPQIELPGALTIASQESAAQAICRPSDLPPASHHFPYMNTTVTYRKELLKLAQVLHCWRRAQDCEGLPSQVTLSLPDRSTSKRSMLASTSRISR